VNESKPLISGGLDGSIQFPPADELVAQCGKAGGFLRTSTRSRSEHD
jgi:hypothetical protein